MDCDHCDGEVGSAATVAGQVRMRINGKIRGIDHCIHQIVAALNAGGVSTLSSCCGHGKTKGNIVLEDGRILIIQQTPSNVKDWNRTMKL